MFTTRFRSIIVGLGVFVSLFFVYTSEANQAFVLNTFDTISGYSAQVRVEGLQPASRVRFFITAPDAEVYRFEEMASLSGTANLFVDEQYIQGVGTYVVQAFLDSGMSMEKSFFVYSGDVSPEQSSLASQQSLVSTNSKFFITVDLRDENNNPIANHALNLISNRPVDTISAQSSQFTDSHGKVVFIVSSPEEGISYFSAYDTTASLVLNSRLKIIFSQGSSQSTDIGGDDTALLALNSTEPGYLDHFRFENLPEIIKSGTPFNFTLTAVDTNNQTIFNYLGTIHFSLKEGQGTSVTLPQDYTFVPDDLGSHTFNLGLTFPQSGLYVLEVRDLKNKDIVGTVELNIGNDSGVSPSPSSSQNASSALSPSKDILIKSPSSGTFSTNIQTISGTAIPGIDVKLFDNGEEIGVVTADSKGAFTFTSAPLADGAHHFSAVIVNEAGVQLSKSEEIVLKIDTKGALVEKLELSPSDGISPSGVVAVTLYSEPNLKKVSVIVLNTLFDLVPASDSPGKYQGSFQAPSTVGNYSVDVVLKDQLGNEQMYKSQASFVVQNLTPAVSIGNGSSSSVPNVLGIKPPSQVTGLIAYPGDGKVTLVWDPATDDTGIKHYRLYYGISPDSLINVANTFDNSTTWYIPSLSQGTMYYFGLTAIDFDDNESTSGSEVISASPSGSASNPSAPQMYSSAEYVQVSTPTMYGGTGPETSVAFLIGMLGSLGYFIFDRRQKKV